MSKRWVTSSGQSLVEMVVVIGVVVTLVTAVIAGTTASLHSASSQETRSQAIRYAEEGMELTRAKRDAGWNEFATLVSQGPLFCVGDDQKFVHTTDICVQNVSKLYTRVIRMTLVTTDIQRAVIDVKVSWLEGSQTRVVELQTYLTQWQ